MNFCKTRDVKSPTRGTPLSAGLDLYVPNDWLATPQDDSTLLELLPYARHTDWPGQVPRTCGIPPGHKVVIPSGIKFNVPHNHALVAFNKSGVAVKKGLQIGACVIDEDYTGEVQLHLTNVGKDICWVSPGEKLVQLLLVPVVYADVEEKTESECFAGKVTTRGEGKFGSTDHV